MMFFKKLSRYFIFQDSNPVHCNLHRLNYSGVVSNEFSVEFNRYLAYHFGTSFSASVDTLLGPGLPAPEQKFRQTSQTR